MSSRKAIRGRILKTHAPEWEPLLNLAPDHVGDFMWMGTVQLTDGTRLQAYGLQLVNRYRSPVHPDVSQRVVFLGDDLEGVQLEVVAVEEEEEDFVVIHAMNMRNRFRGLYEEARQWAK